MRKNSGYMTLEHCFVCMRVSNERKIINVLKYGRAIINNYFVIYRTIYSIEIYTAIVITF